MSTAQLLLTLVLSRFSTAPRARLHELVATVLATLFRDCLVGATEAEDCLRKIVGTASDLRWRVSKLIFALNGKRPFPV